jgi:decaprenylphospho-beta-D-erythro-pentofuranosid-2-ulose 2-reductase
MQNVLIFGATSAIAEATARIHAERGDRLMLVARDPGRLGTIADDLRIRGAAWVETRVFDANRFEDHRELVDSAFDDAFDGTGRVDVALIAHGTLPDQAACEADFDEALGEIRVNALGSVSLLTHLANRFEGQGGGVIAVITSVAGDRGRQSNYVYGSSKAMVSVFLQGLRNRLHRAGVAVVDIRPGFVDTPMTRDFDKGALWASPEQVARGIVAAVCRRRATAYVPWFWRYVMWVIRMIPETVFKRLRL